MLFPPLGPLNQTNSARQARPAGRILNCRPSARQEDDWTMATLACAPKLEAPLPHAVDLRADWWTVGDQGATGSCVGWAVADSVLRWHFVQKGVLGESELLSVRFIWMASKETDEFVARPSTFLEAEGTSLKAALEVARKYGTVLDRELPFTAGELAPHDPSLFYALAAERRIASYINLGRDQTAWRRWLATQGPILARVEVDASWMTATSGGGKLTKHEPRAMFGGHAVAIVGYTPGEFIVRNSWGTSWGDAGFAYASEAYVGAGFTEAYGVTV